MPQQLPNKIAGNFEIRDTVAGSRIKLNPQKGNVQILDKSGGKAPVEISLENDQARLILGGKGKKGDIIINDSNSKPLFYIDGGTGELQIRNASRKDIIVLDGPHGSIVVKDGSGRALFKFEVAGAVQTLGAADNPGDLFVMGVDGNPSIHLDGRAGDIKLLGGDCAEEFDVSPSDNVSPGDVLVVDDAERVHLCRHPYDRRVVGVASGGGEFRPGIILDTKRAAGERIAIALMGKVSCKADAGTGPIEVGDLLTTSDRPGYAMKASDPLRAAGCVLGKALSSLSSGRGTIRVLVALQ